MKTLKNMGSALWLVVATLFAAVMNWGRACCSPPRETAWNEGENLDLRAVMGLPAEATDAELASEVAKLKQAYSDLQAETKPAPPQAEKKEPEAPATPAAPTEEEDKEAAANAAELATAQGNLATVNAELAAEREVSANALLDAAVLQGRVSPAERAAWVPKLTADDKDVRVAALNSLQALKSKLNTKPLDTGGRREEVVTADNAREAVSNAMSELQEKGHSYDTAWGMCKADARFATFFNPETAG